MLGSDDGHDDQGYRWWILEVVEVVEREEGEEGRNEDEDEDAGGELVSWENDYCI